MKKFYAIMLVLVLALSLLTACGDNSKNNGSGKGTPSAPQNLTVAADGAEVVLLWDAPADDGGSEVTGYYVSKGDSDSYFTNDTFYTFPKSEHTFEDGTEYTFTVRAENANGKGAEAKVTATSTGGGNNDSLLVSGEFSMKAPEGWEVKMSEGDPEANDPNSDGFIQLTSIGRSSPTATAEETIQWYFDTFRMGEPVAVKVNGYDAKTNERKDVYYVPGIGYMTAVINFSGVDEAVKEAVLATFKING